MTQVSAAKLCFVFTFGFLANGSAEVIIDTLSPLAAMPLPSGEQATYAPLDADPPDPNGTYTLGQSFTFNNNNPNHFLTSVSLSLSGYFALSSLGQNQQHENISVGLYADDGSIPGNLLATLNGPSNPDGGISKRLQTRDARDSPRRPSPFPLPR